MDNEMELQGRVRTLETNVESLHRDSVKTQTSLDNLTQNVVALAGSIHEIGNKLDTQRTKRPELVALSSLALIILTIMFMAITPTREKVDQLREDLKYINATIDARAYIVGANEAKALAAEKDIDFLISEIAAIKANRFTKADGMHLEDTIHEHITKPH